MSDQISVSFSLNSNEFVAEVQKAQKGLDGVSNNTIPDLEKRMSQAQATAKKTADSIRGMEPAAKSTGTGLLQLAYFADDAQYGLKGILNNIPGIVQGLGMGAGIAGAISLVALAANIAWPALKKLYSSADTQGAIDAAKEYGNVLKQNLKKIEETNAALEVQKQLAASQIQFSNQVKADATNQSPAISMAQNAIDALQKQKALEEQILQAKIKAAAAEEKLTGGTGANAENSGANALNQLAQNRLTQEIELQRKLSQLQTDEINRLQVQADSTASFFQKAAQEIDAEITKMERNLAFAEANAAQARKEASDKDLSSSEARNAQANLVAAEARLAKDKEALATAQAIRQATMENAAVAKQQYQDAMRAASQASTEAERKARELEIQKSTATELAQLQERERLATQAQVKAEQEMQKAEKARAAAKRQAVEESRAEEKRKSQELSLRAVTGEILALRAQAAGQNAIAKEIRNRIALAQEAKNIADATGLDEQKALALAREKQRLEQGLEKTSGKRVKDGRIRLYKAGEAPGTLQRGEGAAARKADAFQQRTQAWMGSPQKVVTNTQDMDQAQLKTLNQILRLWQKSIGTI